MEEYHVRGSVTGPRGDEYREFTVTIYARSAWQALQAAEMAAVSSHQGRRLLSAQVVSHTEFPGPRVMAYEEHEISHDGDD